MSELDDAMQQYMAYIVFHEHSPFSFKDFLCFEWEGKEYKPNYGTIRNKFDEFTEKGIIELDYKTNIAFYTLKGYRFGKKPMTTYPAGVTVSHNHPMYKILEGLVLDKASFHNIPLAFTVPNIYKIFSINTDFTRIERSEQIVIPPCNKNNARIRIVISKTDTVSVMVACSLQPIPLDFNGINRFSSILGNSEGRLQTRLEILSANHEKINQIPDCGKWIITQWHFNRDALQEYTGKGISITFENAEHIIYRIYSKQFGKHKHKRIERQEYRRMTVEELIEEKLNS